jgi:hypothetical protein
MISARLTDAERCRNRAEEVRQIAAGMRDADAKGILIRVAADYEKMAAQLEAMDAKGREK